MPASNWPGRTVPARCRSPGPPDRGQLAGTCSQAKWPQRRRDRCGGRCSCAKGARRPADMFGNRRWRGCRRARAGMGVLSRRRLRGRRRPRWLAPGEGVSAASAVGGDGIGVADVGEADLGARHVVARGLRQLAADPMCGGACHLTQLVRTSMRAAERFANLPPANSWPWAHPRAKAVGRPRACADIVGCRVAALWGETRSGSSARLPRSAAVSGRMVSAYGEAARSPWFTPGERLRLGPRSRGCAAGRARHATRACRGPGPPPCRPLSRRW